MSKVLCIGTVGAERPGRARFVFAAALIATQTGDEAEIVLRGDATLLMKDSVRAQLRDDCEWPSFSELLQRVVDQAIPIFV